MTAILRQLDDRGVARITLNRPERHNAFDDALLAELAAALADWCGDERVRVIVLAAAGPSFSAGADLGWMQRTAAAGEAENYRDALALADFFRALATVPKPTIALVQGPAIGGGVGLVAACDIGVAADNATFTLPEVRLGLIPAVISPYVIRAIGERQSQRLALTGEGIDAAEALRLGLLHRVVAADGLAAAGEELCRRLIANAPAAMAAVKKRLSGYRSMDLAELSRYTAGCIARQRSSAEGREGIAAFLGKRKPDWVRSDV